MNQLTFFYDKSAMKPFHYTLDPEKIPTRKILCITPDHDDGPTVEYECPDECWLDHCNAWGKQWRDGNKSAPRPMSIGYYGFDRPTETGCIPYGCNDPTVIRAAYESHVRYLLHGWDEDLKKTAEGREKLEAIVNASVNARMKGLDVGAMPYIACVHATL